jgi:hypothetical protein
MKPPQENPPSPPGMESERTQSVLDFVDKLSDNIHQLELDEERHGELNNHIHNVRERLSSPPGHTVFEQSVVDDIVDDALVAMHRVLSSSTTQKATELLQEAGRFLTGVG